MYAIADINKVQFRLQPNDKVRIPLQKGAPGDVVTFSNILLAGNDDQAKVGSPYIKGTIEGTILAHGRDNKVIVFKKKRRKGYRKLNGHKQDFTLIQVTKMDIDGFEAFVGEAEDYTPAPEEIAADNDMDEKIFDDGGDDEIEETAEIENDDDPDEED